MKYFDLVINEDRWNVYLVPVEDYEILDEDSHAETHPYKKEMYFRDTEISLNTVRHEVFHCFYSYINLFTAQLKPDQVEEVAAELFANRAERMLSLSQDIYDKLKELRDKEEG